MANGARDCSRRRLVLRLVHCSVAPPGASCHHLGTSSRPSLGISARLAWLATLATACRGRRLPLLPVTLAGKPLLPNEELPASGDGPRERLWLIVVDDLTWLESRVNQLLNAPKACPDVEVLGATSDQHPRQSKKHFFYPKVGGCLYTYNCDYDIDTVKIVFLEPTLLTSCICQTSCAFQLSYTSIGLYSLLM
ncbi:unnamed protein product [Miscanthus lutarioriparius]|uniref:Uncharacterized protein n=1 Tax=Miscanthus lutarioriparius TaxID=422564 RepID=A0A811PMF2_9POAL|nr:unnamed protein product [Miscanthus lutarioriparius]